MENISKLLDKAKARNGLPSDYKLALSMGISHVSLLSYRSGKTLPDTRVIAKLCDLTGDDPELLSVEIEAKRARTPEARELWSRIAYRLQVGAANLSLIFAVAILVIAATGPLTDAAASPAQTQATDCALCLIALIRLAVRIWSVLAKNVKVCKAGANVPRTTDSAPVFNPA